MSFLEQLVGAGDTSEYRSSLANPDEWLLEAFSATASYSGQRVNLDQALTLTPFRSAVMLISETVGMLPLKVYREIGDGSKATAREHRTYRMLHDRPNPITPAHRFWSTVATHLLIWNNAYIEKLRGSTGLVEELWVRDPAKVIVEWDDSTKRKRFYEETSGGRRYWNEDQLLHISGWSVNGITGESLLHRGRQTIGNALAREEFEGAFYKRGAIFSGIIEYPGQLKTDAAVDRLKGLFKSRYEGSKKAFGTPVLEEGAVFKPNQMSLVDLAFEEAQQRSRTEIAVMFRLPPSFLGGTTGDSLTYATVESNMIQFVQHTIAPWTNMIAVALAGDPGLFPFQSWFPEFVLEGLLRADSKARAEFYKTLTEVGAILPNEIRGRENLAPLDGGDELHQPSGTPPPLDDPAEDPVAV